VVTKEKKQIDYSKVPQHVFDKDWEEFLLGVRNIEEGLKRVEIGIRQLENL
jgi:hypothetical protein